VFNVPSGPAVNATLIDMGTRFRLIVNEIQVVSPDAPLPKLPVARAVWVPKPDLRTGAAAWILAGGAHHFGFSQAIGAQYLEDLAEMADVEFVLIGSNTTLSELKKELRWNQVYYHLEKGL
jgi:L-arabinose isomerase